MSSESGQPKKINFDEYITGYVPKMVLTIAAMACFGALAAIFCYRFWRTRTHRWMLCLTIGTITMAAGFGVRIPLTDDPGAMIIYVIHTLLTLLSPCAFLAHIYMLLPRLATYLEADDCLYLRPRLIARTFVWLDVVIFFIQMAGSGMSSQKDLAKIGTAIATVGLVIQCITFGAFTALALFFAYKLNQLYPHKWANSGATWRSDWRVVFYAMMYNCVLILVRCIFRVAEFAQGYSGELRTTEWYIYVFDTLPLVLAISAWAIFWPPRCLGNGKETLYSTRAASGDSSENGIGMTNRPMLYRDPYSENGK